MMRVAAGKDGHARFWFVAVIALAVCALTASVTTRYTSSPTLAAHALKTAQHHSSIEKSRQRLTKDAMYWLPPYVESALFLPPVPAVRVLPVKSTLLDPFFSEALHNRPPPASFRTA